MYSKEALGVRAGGFKQNLEYSMRSATLHIFFSVPNKPILLSSFHQFQTIQIMSDRILSQSLNKNTVQFGLVQVKSFRLGEVL